MHVAFLYVAPVVLAIVAARVSGTLAGERSTVLRWLLVLVLGLIVPQLALQFFSVGVLSIYSRVHLTLKYLGVRACFLRRQRA